MIGCCRRTHRVCACVDTLLRACVRVCACVCMVTPWLIVVVGGCLWLFVVVLALVRVLVDCRLPTCCGSPAVCCLRASAGCLNVVGCSRSAAVFKCSDGRGRLGGPSCRRVCVFCVCVCCGIWLHTVTIPPPLTTLHPPWRARPLCWNSEQSAGNNPSPPPPRAPRTGRRSTSLWFIRGSPTSSMATAPRLTSLLFGGPFGRLRMRRDSSVPLPNQPRVL